LYWVLPYCQDEFKSKPLDYFSHLFGHEGENSVLSYLKKEGLAMELSAGGSHTLNCFSDFFVQITLTKKGLQNYEQVIAAIFKYAQRLAEVGPQEYIFDESAQIGKIKFDFLDKSDPINYCVRLAERMHGFKNADDMGHLISHSYTADFFDKERCSEFAKLLSDPSNTLTFVTSQSFDVKDLPEQQKWYKIDYKSEPYSESFLALMKNPVVAENGLKLDLPPANNLIPKNFDILPDNAEMSK